MKKRVRVYLGASSLAAALLLLAPAFALSGEAAKPPRFPERPLEMIVPFAAGGGLDASARLLAKYAERELGEKINVVNRTAGGNIQGNLEGIGAPPDGYVMGIWGMGLVTDELVIRNVPYTRLDVQPLCMYANDPHLISVGRDFARRNGIATLADLVAHAKANPGRVTFGTGGNWTSHDFVRIKLEEEAGIKFVRMPFLGGGPATRALADGNCDVSSPFPPEYYGVPDPSKVLPLAVTYDTRMAQFPDLPTGREAGFPNLVQSMWRVITLPKETPRPIVDYLADVFARAVADPGFVREAREMGINPVFMGPDDLARFIEAEHQYFEKKTAEWGIRIPAD